MQRFDGDGISYVVDENLDTLTVTVGDSRTGFDSVRLDIGAFAEKLLREYGDAGSSITGSMTPEAMTTVAEQNGQKVKLLLRRLVLVRGKGKVTIRSFTADVAYRVRQ